MKLISQKEALTQGLNSYFTGKPCKHGHISQRRVRHGQCRECEWLHQKTRLKGTRAKTKSQVMRQQAIASGQKKYSTGEPCVNGHFSQRYSSTGSCVVCISERGNKDRMRKSSDHQHRQRQRESYRKYYQKNKEMVGIKNQAYKNKREKSDPVFAMRKRVRVRVCNALRAVGGRKSVRTEQMLGCSFEYFKLHIERQFRHGMGWHNRDLWHVDHIIPLATAKTEDEIVSLTHFTNLRPIWATENLSKKHHVRHLI